MHRIIDLAIPLHRLRLLVVPFIFILTLHGCAGIRSVEVIPPPLPTRPAETIKQNEFFIGKEDDAIGRPAVIRLEKGDTLPDIARHFSLGIHEISLANPGVDIWVPEAGTRIMLPLHFILPDAPQERHRDQPGRDETLLFQGK
jgi:L,D-transpeptidase ErfK/SrfK